MSEDAREGECCINQTVLGRVDEDAVNEHNWTLSSSAPSRLPSTSLIAVVHRAALSSPPMAKASPESCRHGASIVREIVLSLWEHVAIPVGLTAICLSKDTDALPNIDLSVSLGWISFQCHWARVEGSSLCFPL